MTWELFSTIGHLGVALGLAAVLSCLTYGVVKKRFLCRLGLGFAIGAFICASVNSATYVNRIQIDPAAKLAEAEAKREARRQAALDSRGEEVAQIRFAEDSEDEFLDKAGMDEADLKYIESTEEPAWKKEKKTRSGGDQEDDSLKGLIDDEEQEGGADVVELEQKAGPKPILMSEKEVVMANRLDRWNLRLSRYLVIIAVIILLVDYLRRVNIYREASIPLPLPSAWPNSVTPMPAVVERPHPARREIVDELTWLARRGDSFIYFTDKPNQASDTIHKLKTLKIKRAPLELLSAGMDEEQFDNDFVFEALWFGRSSFVVDSPDRANKMLPRFLELIKGRRATRACTSQTVHIVWDLTEPIPEKLRQAFADFGGSAGFSLFLVRPAAA